jgi:uncharacterized membrane protein
VVDNPYAPPQARVADAAAEMDGDFLPEGRRVPAGNGWSWIAEAWAFTGLQRGTFIGIFVIYGLLLVGVSVVPFGGSLAVALFSPVLTAGIVLGCDALRRGERLEVAHLFAGFKSQVGPLIGLGGISLGAGIAIVLIIVVIFGATYFAMMGSGQPGPENMVTLILMGVLAMLVVVALSIPLYMAVFFAPALIVLHNFKLGEALKASFHACWRNMLPFLVWGVVALVLAIVASLPLFLGWLLLGPVMLVSMYVAYRDIFFVR